jgi:DNA-binding transcriptional regulator YiaG
MIKKNNISHLRQSKVENNRPEYKKIFEDIIIKNCPERKEEFNHYFLKKQFSIMDVITLNSKIFNLNDKETLAFNQQHRSYDEPTILKILRYQKKQGLNNVELANHFNLSRNTVTKWRKIYSTSLI